MDIRLGLALGLLLMTAQVCANRDLRYIDLTTVPSNAVVIDARALSACRDRSLARARCLPALDLQGPRGELPSFRDILWALGTAGLSGGETAIVAGDDAVARDFVAGVLYLSGQRRVWIVRQSLSELLRNRRFVTGPGMQRGMLRSQIYRAPMRDHSILLHAELQRELTDKPDLVPVDGRGKRDFRGAEGRSRIRGALNVPLALVHRSAVDGQPVLPGTSQYVAYGYAGPDSIALFAYLTAVTDADVRVLLNGWRSWAGNVQPAAANTETYTVAWHSQGLLALFLAALAMLILICAARATRRRKHGFNVSRHHG